VSAARLLAVVLALFALSVAIAACGDDDEDEGVSIPSIAVPETTATAPATTAPETTTAPDTGGTGTTKQPKDTAKNDVPPPSGTPQEQFEQFCEQNPGACGD
jgi:hypothetical protein